MQIPKPPKIQSSCQSFLVLLGSTHVEAARKMLVKCTPESREQLRKALSFKKGWNRMLMKLTPGHCSGQCEGVRCCDFLAFLDGNSSPDSAGKVGVNAILKFNLFALSPMSHPALQTFFVKPLSKRFND